MLSVSEIVEQLECSAIFVLEHIASLKLLFVFYRLLLAQITPKAFILRVGDISMDDVFLKIANNTIV